MTTQLTIDPITRLEGHGKIEIFLDDNGDVDKTYFQVPELRGFEAFCVGRPVEEMPLLTNRICGVCPEAHHLAAAKAVDAVYRRDPSTSRQTVPRTDLYRLLRNRPYHPLLRVERPGRHRRPGSPVAERNILGVIRKVGPRAGRPGHPDGRGGHHVIEVIGGRASIRAPRSPAA